MSFTICQTIWITNCLTVDYAVGLMVILRCTQTVLFRLKQFDDAPDCGQRRSSATGMETSFG
jgi:hypothetical protein